jgi:hypothetical protein
MPDRHDGQTTLAPRRRSGGEHGPRATATPKSFVDAAFEREELTALHRITWARVAVVAAIVLWISANYGPMNVWDSMLLTSLFAVAGLVQYRLTARHRDWR